MRLSTWVITAVMGFGPATVAGQALDLYCNENGTAAYDTASCEGVELLAAGNSAAAVEQFEAALAARRFEFPNFQLLAPLAIAQYRVGEVESALKTIELARITLNIFTGYYQCLEGEDGFSLRAPGAGLNPELAAEAVRRMCGAAYEYVYEPQPLERHLLDAWLIEFFFAAREEVIGGARVDTER